MVQHQCHFRIHIEICQYMHFHYMIVHIYTIIDMLIYTHKHILAHDMHQYMHTYRGTTRCHFTIHIEIGQYMHFHYMIAHVYHYYWYVIIYTHAYFSTWHASIYAHLSWYNTSVTLRFTLRLVSTCTFTPWSRISTTIIDMLLYTHMHILAHDMHQYMHTYRGTTRVSLYDSHRDWSVHALSLHDRAYIPLLLMCYYIHTSIF